jgi:RNA polymerase sigma-70 factor (ECF subfamily)
VPPEIERLYREHRAGLVRLVERELRDRHDAEDVVQTAFLDAQRALERGTIPRNPPAWLAAIALNTGRRLRRRRLNAQPLEEYAVQEASEMPELRAALAGLPKEQQKAVVYRDLLGLSYGETAEQMGTTVNAVTMLLHRGRRGLRQTLGAASSGVWLWRWMRRAGVPQAAVAKGSAAVVVAAGLATTGIVAARVVAPIGTDAKAAAPATRFPSPTKKRGRLPRPVRALDPTRHDAESLTRASARAVEVPRSAQASSVDPTPTSVAEPPESASSQSTSPSSTLPVPTPSLPTLSVPTLAVTVPATVTVSTPVATVSVTTPTLTTATVTTPIATVTLPIP